MSAPVATRPSGTERADAHSSPVSVEVVRHPVDEELICGFSIDDPSPERPSRTYGMLLQGWVVSPRKPPVAVELLRGSTVLARIPLDIRRPDIARLHPDVEWAANAGFRAGINAVRLPERFEVDVQAVLRGEQRVRLATLRGTRRLPAVAAARDAIQPVLLTTLGRSGSTWVTRLLGCHPGIVSYRPFEYETRVASYWADVMAVLSDPASYVQVLRGDLTGDDWWTGRSRSGPLPTVRIDEGIDDWLARRHVEEMAPFVVRQVEAFYRHVADVEGREGARYFVEKFAPGPPARDVVRSLYPGAREIVLVRDFRDMVCSIFAYNQKRGVESFGRQGVDSDEAYLERLRSDALRLLGSWTETRGGSHLLRYEDLIREPEATLEAAFAYLGVGHDDARIEQVLEAARALTPDAQVQHRTASSTEASVGRWRRDLPEPLQVAAAAAFDDVLEGFGYDPAS